MFKSLSFGLLGALFLCAPAQARIEPGTGDLLRLMHSKGVRVVEGQGTCPPGVSGMFINNRRPELHICFSGTPTANDHDTVRHEAWHYLQSCVTPGSGRLRTFFDTKAQFVSFVEGGLHPRQQDSIKLTYPHKAHATEFEAFAAANRLTATQIATYIRQYCRAI